jgi:UDP-galactopyranose mutase
MIKGVPHQLRERASTLEALSLRVLMIVVADPLRDAPQRVYISDASIPPHKVAFNHTSSPELRRRPVHAVMCEISHSPYKPLPDNESLERATVDWLIDSGLVPHRSDIARIEHFDTEFGYPVYTHARPAIMEEIRAWLEPKGIFTFGRFGGWDYANSDEFIRQGKELAQRLAGAASRA